MTKGHTRMWKPAVQECTQQENTKALRVKISRQHIPSSTEGEFDGLCSQTNERKDVFFMWMGVAVK